MKIVHLNTLFAPRRFGGAEVFLEQLSEAQAARGHQVLVACLSPEPTQRGTDQLQVHEFQLRNVYWPYDGRRESRMRKAVWHLRNAFGSGGAADIDQFLTREKPDLVHTHNLSGFTSAVWQTIASHRVPLVHTIHDYALLCPSTTMFRRDANCEAQCFGCRMLSWPKRGHSKAVNAVVGVSDFVLSRHVDNGYFPHATRHVVHNGDTRGREPVERTPAAAPSVLRVGYLGRLTRSKGVELMLDALAPLIPNKCELLFGGAGDESYETMLKSRYERPGVRFLGRVDATEFLQGIDVLVVPSLWHEPFGLVLCEAMSAGVPVVASAVGGIPEIVEHGHSGFLFGRGDAESLRGHVARLAADRPLLAQMTSACRDVAETCRFDRTVERYSDVYRETLNGVSPPKSQLALH